MSLWVFFIIHTNSILLYFSKIKSILSICICQGAFPSKLKVVDVGAARRALAVRSLRRTFQWRRSPGAPAEPWEDLRSFLEQTTNTGGAADAPMLAIWARWRGGVCGGGVWCLRATEGKQRHTDVCRISPLRLQQKKFSKVKWYL